MPTVGPIRLERTGDSHRTPRVRADGAAIVEGRRAERIRHLERLAGQLPRAERAAIAAALPALLHLVELGEQ
ncbi:hypothetical protein [Amycolatopsis methanolica]|uniref:MarR family transcriptional regulator n=1 Tax=Amycolatopsis methanolica 239 TaxID=1068978 RepID=A0A076N7Y1_AMYME|nr:hypothetical protein AMETH_6020 [Amycolatopsis methanolica 239]